jgi:NAD(P)H dehydrogenase (quinone)
LKVERSSRFEELQCNTHNKNGAQIELLKSENVLHYDIKRKTSTINMETVIKTSARTLAQVGEALGLRNLDPESGKIFITDGSGVIGHRVATRLCKAGYPSVRLGGFSPGSLPSSDLEGVEIADFNWTDTSTYDKALKGIKSVLITIPYTEKWYHNFSAFIGACHDAHVKHIVKLSFYHARNHDDVFHEVPLVRQHGMCDQELIQMVKPEPPLKAFLSNEGVAPGMDMYVRPNMSYTILFATHYMSDPFTFQGAELRSNNKPSAMYGATRNHGVNYVSPNDVAEVAVRVLLAPCEHYDKTYTLTGPKAITDHEVASHLSKYLRKPIMYVDQPLDVYSTELKVSGNPRFVVEDMVAFERVKATGTEEDHAIVSKDIETICGHPPETYQEYLLATDMMTDVEAGPPRDDLVPLKEVVSN